MNFWILGLSAILLSGCASKSSVVIGGVEDFIRVPKASKIADVPLPTDENKKYTVLTQKDGVWLSLDAWNRLEKGK